MCVVRRVAWFDPVCAARQIISWPGLVCVAHRCSTVDTVVMDAGCLRSQFDRRCRVGRRADAEAAAQEGELRVSVEVTPQRCAIVGS